MHICLKCARAAKSVDEIENGCPCGSKVFVYKHEEPECKRLEPLRPSANSHNGDFHNGNSHKNSGAKNPDEEHDEEPGHEYNEVWLSKGAQVEKLEVQELGSQNDDDDSGEQKIENILQIKRGVFEVDLLGLKNGPLVVRDQEGVYYVRLPFEHAEEED
ncbi:MAG: Zn-ribbon containing protein [Candidatus Micrarchaeota archaeon]